MYQFSLSVGVIFFASSAGALQSAFFSAYLFSEKGNNLLFRRVLAFLTLALAVRVSKSVMYYFYPDQLPLFFENLGYAAQVMIGPLIYLFVKAVLDKNYIVKRYHVLHFIPGLIVLILCTRLTDDFWLKNNAYPTFLWLGGIYIAAAHYSFVQTYRL